MRAAPQLLITMLALFLAACSNEFPSPEEMVRERIEEGRDYAANRKIEQLVGMVTDDFAASRGITRENLPTWLARFYLTTRSPQVLVRIREITADSQTAKATLLVGMANVSLEEINFDNFRGRLLHMVIDFRLVDETWMVT
ncbi:MAG: hypothetical protein R3179_08100, partial [Sedimenticolaceae bacterium]|nr:hypothetical protein [Sedimenticolaceae bacterium]